MRHVKKIGSFLLMGAVCMGEISFAERLQAEERSEKYAVVSFERKENEAAEATTFLLGAAEDKKVSLRRVHQKTYL